MPVHVRKIVVHIEDTRHDGGPVLDQPVRKGYVAAVVANPFAGRHEDDLLDFMDELRPLGLELSAKLIDAIAGGDAKRIQAYGKGAIVGADGELEHGALWHAPGGYAMREALGEALAIVPSTKKVGGLGARLDVPLHHKDAAYVRSHFDAIEVGLADAPKRGEILFALVMGFGGRPHARMGGLEMSEISKYDGLR